MLSFCPDMILKLGEGYKNDETVSNDLTIEGIFNGTKAETFFNVIIKEPTGKTTKLILLDYFENAYLISYNGSGFPSTKTNPVLDAYHIFQLSPSLITQGDAVKKGSSLFLSTKAP